MISQIDPSKFTAPETAVLLAEATVCIIIIFAGIAFGLSKFLRAIKARKISKDGLELGEATSTTPVSVHRACGNGKDWVVMFAEHEDMLYSVYTKEFRILDKQLTIVDSELAIIRGTAQGIFLKLLKKKLRQSSSEGLIDHIDYERYEHALTKARESLLPSLKKDFDLDEIEKMGEEQFRDYANLHAGKLAQDLTDFLNLHYAGTVLKREDLYDGNRDSISDQFFNTLVSIYWSARKVAVETKKETSALRSEFRDRLREMI